MMSSPRDLAPMKRVASGGDESTEGRDRWPSRTSFIFAAIGSAVGIGNLWRFPYQSFKFGGGAFFVPYLLALFFIGIPMLQLEFALGQTYQGGHLKTFDKVGKRFRGLGLAAPFFAFVVTTYYSAILGWSLIYFVNSFSGSLPWAVSAGEAKLCASVVDEITCAARNACTWIVDDEICTGAVLKKATSFFVESINLESDPKASLSLAGSGYVVAGLFCTWLVTFVAIAKGAKFLGYVVYFTMGVPLLLLAIITARGASLPGAGDGIRHYIGIWDMGQLSEQPEMWTAAVGQIFFSIGVCYGVMTAYASFNSPKQNAVQDAFIVSISNSVVSIVAGFAVFSIAGHLAHESGQDISELRSAGVGLVFWTFPTGLAQLPTPAAQIFSVLFFLTFFLLGIDSAFSLAEALITVFCDSKVMKAARRVYIVAPVCIGGFLIGLFYAAGIGSYILDAVDFYVSNIATLFVGFCQAVAAGWFYGRERQEEKLGRSSIMIFNGSFFAALVLGCALGFGLSAKEDWTGNTTVGGIIGPIIGVSVFICGTCWALFRCHAYTLEGERLTAKQRLYYLTIGNVEQLRADLNAVVAQDRNCGCFAGPRLLSVLTPFWSFLMKFFIPATLMLLSSQSFSGPFLEYEDLPSKYQITGALVAFFGMAVILFAFFKPMLCASLMPESDDSVLSLMKSTPEVDPDDEEGPTQMETHVVVRNVPADDSGRGSQQSEVFATTGGEEGSEARAGPVSPRAVQPPPVPSDVGSRSQV
eukprot:Polyplicarium_translucidae@DN3385_c1_g1_i20.p1